MEYDLAFAADTALGSALNFMLPSIKTWLDATLREAVFMPYVTPEHYFLPIEEGVADVSLPVGMLILTVVEARGVPRCVDAYCLPARAASPRRRARAASPRRSAPIDSGWILCLRLRSIRMIRSSRCAARRRFRCRGLKLLSFSYFLVTFRTFWLLFGSAWT